MRKRRYGVFRIPCDIISYDFALATRILQGKVIYKAEYEPCRRCIVYAAEAKCFDLIEEGTLAPEYELILKETRYRTPEGDVNVAVVGHTFKRTDGIPLKITKSGTLKMCRVDKNLVTKKGY
jgi:hypothetical protein